MLNSSRSSATSHLTPPLPPKPGFKRPPIQQQQQQTPQLPDLIMNYSQSSIVDRFAQEDAEMTQQLMQHNLAMSEAEEMAAMGKNAFMPQPMLGANTLWNLEQQQKSQQKQMVQSSEYMSRQPDFESVNAHSRQQERPQQVTHAQQPNSGTARQNESGFSDQCGGPAKKPQSANLSINQQHQQQPNSNMLVNYVDQSQIPADQWQSIIDWVNSFNDPSCLLVSSYEDFQDGLALCHLVAAIACNNQDQVQMYQLVHQEHNYDPVKMEQNVDLALNVLRASTVSLPDSITVLTPQDIQTSEIHCFMFLETLRQAKNLGIIKLLEQASPIKKVHTQMNDDSIINDENQSVLQQSPIELQSTRRLDQQQHSSPAAYSNHHNNMLLLHPAALAGSDYNDIANTNHERSLHEIVPIDSTLESSIDKTVQQIQMMQQQIQAQSNVVQVVQQQALNNNNNDTEVSLSPTFKPGQLSQQMRDDFQHQSYNSADQQNNDDDDADSLRGDEERGQTIISTPTGSTGNKVSGAKRGKVDKKQKGYQVKDKKSTHANDIQSTPNDLHKAIAQQPTTNRSSRSRTSHTQDSNYKPLFTESVSQRKKLQEMQLQVQKYDQVIRNSYDRLSLSNQALMQGQQAMTQSNRGSTNHFTPFTPQSQQQNTDLLLQEARQDLAKLDRQIRFEQEIERQLPFSVNNDDDHPHHHQQHYINSKLSGTEEGSPPRMQSPGAIIGSRIPPQQHHNVVVNHRNPGDDIEHIMQQMQTLNVEKNEFEIHPVDEKTKVRLMRWLVDDVKLISNQLSVPKLLQDLPKYCRNGVLMGDLLNRLQGRDECIKGLHRAPKNMAAISANFEKVLGYLKEFPRFSSRYLWAQSKAIEGNSDVIWGLLDDIWHWHFNKISVYDPAANQDLKMMRSSSQGGLITLTNKSISSHCKPQTASSSRVGGGPEVVIGNGPTKMRDYLKNGEKAKSQMGSASSKTQMSLQQSHMQIGAGAGGVRDNCSPRAKQKRQARQQSQHAALQIADETREKLAHNFNPSSSGKINNNGDLKQHSGNNFKAANVENYHSFGCIQPLPAGNKEAQQIVQRSPLRKHVQSHDADLSPAMTAKVADSRNLNQFHHHQQLSVPQSHRPMRPPKVPSSNINMPLQLTNLSSLSSSATQQFQYGSSNAQRKPPPFQHVPSTNIVARGVVQSARSSHSRSNQNIQNVDNHVNSYAAIESSRGTQRKSRQQWMQNNSQYESPRSYQSALKHKQLSYGVGAGQRSAQNVVAPMSARNSTNATMPSPFQRQQRSSSRNHQKNNLVHMRTSQDYQEMSQVSAHQQSSILPFTQQNHFKSMDSTRSANQQQFNTTVQKYEPKEGASKVKTVDEWLQFLKFHPFMSNEYDFVSLTEDPKRNGVFISELVAYLLPQNSLARSLCEGSASVNQRPASVVECQRNWQLIFTILTQLLSLSGAPSTRLLTKQTMQALLQGDQDALYKLLYSIYDAFYAKSHQTGQQHQTTSICQSSLGGASSTMNTGVHHMQQLTVAPLLAPVEIMRRRMTPSHSASALMHQQAIVPGQSDLDLPYTPEELTQLDLSIIHWLKAIGQLKSMSIDFEKVDSILDLQQVLSNGVLLCALVSRVFKVRITGVFKDPKTETTCLSNLRKAMKVLQTQRKMSQKFTWTEKQVYEGQRVVILGLFEDIHRAFDGLPPRKRGVAYFDDGPYIGERFSEQFRQQMTQPGDHTALISLDECHQESINQHTNHQAI